MTEDQIRFYLSEYVLPSEGTLWDAVMEDLDGDVDLTNDVFRRIARELYVRLDR